MNTFIDCEKICRISKLFLFVSKSVQDTYFMRYENKPRECPFLD